MVQEIDTLTLAARRKYTITFGTGLLLIAVALFLHSKTVVDVLRLAGMGLQLWGLIAFWHSHSSAKKRLKNLNAEQ